MQHSDSELAALYVQGDESALTELVVRYQDKVFGFFLRLCRNRDLAEDLAQETFVKVIKGLEKSISVDFHVFLFRIARIQWYSFLRRKYRAPKMHGKVDEYIDEVGATEDHPEQLEDQEIRSIETRRLLQAVELLVPEQRIVVELAYFLRVPYKEIAEVLEIPVGTVKSRLNSALGQLRGLMEGDQLDETQDS